MRNKAFGMRVEALGMMLLLAATPAFAETIPLPVAREDAKAKAAAPLEGAMTLEQALALGYKQNFGLEIARESVTASDAQEAAALRAMLPSVSLSSSHTQYYRNDSSGFEADTHSAALSITQPIYRGRRLWAGWKTAGLNYEKAVLAEERAVQQFTRNLKAGWYELHRASQVAQETERSLERLKQHAKNANAFYNEGKYWRNDVLQAEVEVARGKQRLAEAHNAVTIASSRLNQLLRQDVTAKLVPADQLAMQPLTLDLPEAFARAKASRPELQQAALDVKSATYTEMTAEAGLQPSIDLTGSWSSAASNIGFSDHQDTQTVLLSVSWELFQFGRTLKQMDAAEAATRQTQLSLGELEDRVQLEVQEAFLNAESAAEKVQVLEQALEQAEENYRVNQIRYREQLSSANDLLDAQSLLTSVRVEYVTALTGYLTALADLELATGETAS